MLILTGENQYVNFHGVAQFFEQHQICNDYITWKAVDGTRIVMLIKIVVYYTCVYCSPNISKITTEEYLFRLNKQVLITNQATNLTTLRIGKCLTKQILHTCLAFDS